MCLVLHVKGCDLGNCWKNVRLNQKFLKQTYQAAVALVFSLSESTQWMESNFYWCFKSSIHWNRSLNFHEVFQLITLIDPPHFLVARHSRPLPCTLGQTDWAWSPVLKRSDSERWVGIPHGFIPFCFNKAFSAKTVWLTVSFIWFS